MPEQAIISDAMSDMTDDVPVADEEAGASVAEMEGGICCVCMRMF
jgi:hypothetical protein